MSESLLIKQAQSGDAAAFSCLVECHYDTLYKFAYRWCGDQTDAEDIAQLACMKLARAIGQYRAESAFTSWLYRLVINCAKDWRRSQERHRTEDDITQEPTVDSKVDDVIYLRQLLQQLEIMGGGLKETVLLVHGEGLTHAEAADILSIKEGTVSWRIREVRQRLNALKAGDLMLAEGDLNER